MQSATCRLPFLLQEIFERYKGSLSIDDLADFYAKLNSALGSRLVAFARQFIDNQTITVFSNAGKSSFLAVITEDCSIKKKRKKKLVHLLPDVNFCFCKSFQTKVLKLGEAYTCEHVLALRLAFLLDNCVNCIQFKEVQPHKFDNLLKEFASASLQGSGDNFSHKMTLGLEYINYRFVGCLENIKTFAAGIRSVGFGDHGIFHINEDGLRCTVEQGKCIQANLFITPSCFSDYHVDGLVHFTINMNVLIECLSIFAGTDCSMKMFYKDDDPLVIILEPHDEDNIRTECSIKTTHYDETMDFSLDADSHSLNTVFIKGREMANIFHDLDKSAEELQITLSPRKPYFKVETLGVMQSECSIEVAKTSEMMILFNCKNITTGRYKISLMRATQRAMLAASKVAIKTDLTGLLEMHFMMQDENQAEVYAQFYITPVVEND
ncbi:cell cycle checkpoint protein RAD1 [Glossina fuscipes]|uniref:Cell cycle checkpoint protein RAD1 n=1 Tax=Glossina fuscipes TaxID=7396 RepID=A0A9C6DLW7_9MUSC|nr:cell cycle checkpoint protein RAD1 [Glossina fuscipes]